MITTIGAILYSVLTGAVSAISVAYAYERKHRETMEDYIAKLDEGWQQAHNEAIELRMEIARQQGISMGRECDAMQRKFIESMNDNQRATVELGKRQNRRI